MMKCGILRALIGLHSTNDKSLLQIRLTRTYALLKILCDQQVFYPLKRYYATNCNQANTPKTHWQIINHFPPLIMLFNV